MHKLISAIALPLWANLVFAALDMAAAYSPFATHIPHIGDPLAAAFGTCSLLNGAMCLYLAFKGKSK